MSKLNWYNEVEKETLNCLDVDILKEELFNVMNFYMTDEEIGYSNTTKNNKLTVDSYDAIEDILENGEGRVDDIADLLQERLRNRVDTTIMNKIASQKLDRGTFIIGYESIKKIIKSLPPHAAAIYVNVYCAEDMPYEKYTANYAKRELLGDKLTPIGNDCYIEYEAKNRYTLDIYCHKAVIQYIGYESLYTELIEHHYLTDIPYNFFGNNGNDSDGEINKLFLKETSTKRRKDLFTAEGTAMNKINKLDDKLRSAILLGVIKLGIKTDNQATELIKQLYKLKEASLPEETLTSSENVALVDKILASLDC